jgi:hypothetical protein
MNNFDHLLNQLKCIQDKFDNIEIFFTGTYLEFQRNQFEKLLAVLEAKQSFICSCNSKQQQIPEEDTLHDAKYAADRIGVSDKTITRLTVQGRLPIDSYVNRKRQFRKSDIERCRRYYRGE